MTSVALEHLNAITMLIISVQGVRDLPNLKSVYDLARRELDGQSMGHGFAGRGVQGPMSVVERYILQF